MLFDRFNDYVLPFDVFDLTLCNEKIKKMEILLGPKTTEAERMIVEALVKQFNHTIKIEQSKLKIR